MTREYNIELLPTQAEFLFNRDKSLDRDVSLFQGGFTCVPADTEYLSPTGWKRIDTLTKDDKLAVYYDNGEIKYEHPLEVFKWNADKWYEFHTRFTHQMLCPNHKIIYWNNGVGVPKSIRCEDYVNAGCNQHFKIKNYFKSGASGTSGFSEAELRLIVAYQADGYNYVKVHNTKISKRKIGFHLKKKNKIDRLIYLLSKCNNEYSFIERKKGLKAGFYDIFSDLPIENYKHFPTEWYNLSDNELAIILDEVKYWDTSKKNGCTTYTYYSNNKTDRDFIQFVAASQGFCTTTHSRERNITIMQNGKSYNYPNAYEYSVSWTKAKPISLGRATMVKAKGGDAKYCPSTTTGMWLARYKNYIFVTGNS